MKTQFHQKKLQDGEENNNTVGLIIEVATDDCLNLKGGAEQEVHSKIARQYIEVVMRSAFIHHKINRPENIANITKSHACSSERSPDGIGKYGLFTLKI